MFLTKTKRSQYYKLVYELNGKWKSVSTKTDNKIEAEIFLSSFIIPDESISTQNISLFKLSDFKNEYINYAKLKFSKSYVERSIEPSFKFLIEYAGDILLNELNLKTLDNFIITKYNSSKSAEALYYRTLKAAFSKAVIWNYLSDNPLKKIKAPKVPKPNPIFISENELNLILDKTSDVNLKNIFTVAFYTGMRLAEILNMRSSWIDIQRNIITLKNSNDLTTKSKKERIIPIHPRIASIVIKQNSNSDDYIFNRKTKIKFNEDYVSKQFKKVLRAAELNDDIHFHSLRHSFASNLVQRGVNLYVVKELLGHEDIKTTQIYSHLTQNSLSNAIQLLWCFKNICYNLLSSIICWYQSRLYINWIKIKNINKDIYGK